MKTTLSVVLLLAICLKSNVADADVIIDTLGVAAPTTQFSLAGSGGPSIGDDQSVGPEFTLATNMVLTEIGAFVTFPVTVQIVASSGGVPDPSTVLGSFPLSDDGDPILVSFESAAIDLTLNAGTYFALFYPSQAGEGGYLLGSASSPFQYLADLITLGIINNGVPGTELSFAAVRITADALSVDEPPLLTLLAWGVMVVVGFLARNNQTTRRRR